MSDEAGFDVMPVARFVARETGLHFPENRVDTIRQAVRRAMRSTRTRDVDAFLDRIREDVAAREELLAELTIGETYFFRDADQFRFIREVIAPGLSRRQTAGHTVRVWSAGCASGEEAYSLAITLREAGLDPERLYVLGTDLSRARLVAAERGRYTRWSLRDVPDSVVHRYFEVQGKHYQLAADVRRAVDFRYLNLAEDRYPALSTSVWGMDVVLCRNVLIYFDGETVRRVTGRLLATLAVPGWLLLGASDPPAGETPDAEAVLTPAGIAYHRRAPDTAERVPPGAPAPQPTEAPSSFTAPAQPPAEPAPLPPSDQVRERGVESGAPGGKDAAREPVVSPLTDPSVEAATAYRSGEYERVTEIARNHLDATGDPALWVLWVRALANQGRLDAADRVCTDALKHHSGSSELAYLHSVLLLQAARPDEAAAAARRALYIDRSMVVGHLALADARLRSPERAAARVSLANALALLAALPADAIVPASDGERAGRLREMVEARLRLLTEAA